MALTRENDKPLLHKLLRRLSLAECLKALGHMEVAAESYTKVVEMAPQHLEARLSLATLQQQLGRPECALKALESMYDSETLAQDSSAAQKARAKYCALSAFPQVMEFLEYHGIFRAFSRLERIFFNFVTLHECTPLSSVFCSTITRTEQFQI